MTVADDSQRTHMLILLNIFVLAKVVIHNMCTSREMGNETGKKLKLTPR